MEHSKTLVIIPCAGYGTRMGMQSNQSKEMLPDPNNNNKPIIDWHLDQESYLMGTLENLVIYRKEKQDLIQHLKTAYQNISYQELPDIEGEWPSTVLASKFAWYDKNILVLPDTRYEYQDDLLLTIEKELETHDLVFACHKVDDVRNWGKILLDPFTKKPLSTHEKADIKFKLEGLAWGLIGFKKHVGEQLFQAYLNKTSFTFPKNWKVKVVELESFKDITRTGKVE